MSTTPPTRPPANPHQQTASRPVPTGEGGGEEEYNDEYVGGGRFLMFNAVPSWLISMVVHAILLLALALFALPDDIVKKIVQLDVEPPEEIEKIEDLAIEDIKPLEVNTMENLDPVMNPQLTAVPDTPIESIEFSNELDSAPVEISLEDFSKQTAPKDQLGKEIGTLKGTGVSGRGAAQRGAMIGKYGGTEASEAAVARALEWLAKHQLPDGGWSFDHRGGSCGARCTHQGSADTARNGATAMALLPFLGAGQTHLEGKYKKTVGMGLDFLVANMKPQGGGGSFHEGAGSMYSHGLAAITLCEAYAMTQDKRLLGPAQASIYFIAYAQDPVGGGWRYAPKSPGDTSVVGWQLMALKSAHMAYLQVPPGTVEGAKKFLDTVGADSGAFYGYTTPGKGKATTAIGLLCRMYLGWDKENPAIERGAQFISEQGPSLNGNRAQMYYNYYATQVMRHYEGELWDKWNEVMRDGLVNAQNTDEEQHMYGSWHFTGDHGADRGGRLYCTSLATMILEVYYRHMPIYQKAAATEDFPL